MGKTMKKILCTLMVVLMCLTSVPVGGLVGLDLSGLDFGATKVSALSSSGSCGDNVTYTYNSSTKALTVSGTGEMENYGYGNSPFYNSDIKSVVIESGVTNIGNYTFFYCTSLTSITIPDSVTSLGDYAFRGCTGLTSVTIPDSVTSIGYYAFGVCTGLASITIPNSVTSIGDSAFSNCTSLTSITIPDSVTSIGDYAFRGCTGLTGITVDSNNTKYSSDSYGVLFNKGKTELIQYPTGNKRTSYAIPTGVTIVHDDAFISCSSLISITIPASVTHLDDEVFHGCVNLANITVDKNNTNISSDIYGVLFAVDNTILWQYPFGSKLTEYVVPGTVEMIGSASSGYLEKIILPEGVTTIADGAFGGSVSLSTIELPKTLKNVGYESFVSCFSLSEITFPENLEYIDDSSLYNCFFLDKVYFKSMDTVFENMSVGYNDAYVEGISKEEFVKLCINYFETGDEKYEEYLKELDDPITIGTIYCHSGSTAEAYAIANDMPYVLTHFFEGYCIYDYDKMICYRKCIHCDEREEFSIDSSFEESRQCGDNAYWSYDDNTGKLDITGTGDMWNFTNSPFRHMNIKSIAIEDGITSVGDYAFAKCYNLTDITIGNGEISIGDYAFYCCDKLSNIAIPDSVVSIGDYSFGNCKGLIDVTIGKGVTSIGDYAFYGCKALTGITVDKNNTKYSSDEYGALFDKDKTILIQYPVGRKTTEYFVPKTVKSIGKRAFVGTIYLEKVVLPEGLTTIDDEAFYQCYSLSTIELPESLKKVGLGSFTECYSISEITFPESLETIDEFAIFHCLFMDKIYFKSMSTVFTDFSVGYSTVDIEGISKEEFVKLYINYFETGDEKYEEYLKQPDDPITIGTIYCHSGSTAEAYAIANNIPYVLTHFFEGDWTYDYDKMIRYRKCIHCDELEIEPLETTEKGDTEIIAPADPDTDFNVDEVKPGSDNYIMVEESFHHHGPEHWQIIKAFDITMTGKDGVHTQPDGTVKVKIPGNWSKHGVYKVYRVNDDGTLTDMHAYRQGSHLVFDTDHFSLYVVVDESDTTDTGSDTPSGGENDDFISRLFAFITRIIEMIIGWFK